MTMDLSPLLFRSDALGSFARTVARACEVRGAEVTLRELLFCLRDMPYRRPRDSASTESVLGEWRGTCSGKHAVVHELLRTVGLRPRLFLRAYPLDAADGLPPHLVEPFRGRGIWDVHTFVRCDLGRGVVAVDVTWPAALEDAGFAVTTRWDGRTDFVIAAPAGEDIEVPAGPDGARCKRERLSVVNSPEAAKAREAFIERLAGFSAHAVPPCTMEGGVESTLARLLLSPRGIIA
jgi:hypothetical protein